MICSNCGYRNQAGDEFCGSCGKFLEWSAVPTEDSPTTVMPPPGAPAGGRQSVPEQPVPAVPVPPPAPPPPRATGRQASTPARPPDAADPGPPPRSRDVACWNCGRRNPATRTFCQQCGERIDSAPAPPVVAAGPAAAAASYADDGGNEGRLIAIGLGLIGLLLLVGLGTFLLLGGLGGPTATPTGAAVVSPMPTFEIPTLPPTPTPTIGVITFPPTESPTLPPTPSPTLPPTPTPTLPPTAPPTPTATPTAPPTPTPTPTAAPTPINCATDPPPTRVMVLTVGEARRTAPALAWCIDTIIFSDGGGEGILKLFLDNEEFIGPPGNYGMSRIGWVEVDIDLFRDSAYVAEWVYPFPYNYLPPGTRISLEVQSCTTEPCTGTVTINFERGPLP